MKSMYDAIRDHMNQIRKQASEHRLGAISLAWDYYDIYRMNGQSREIVISFTRPIPQVEDDELAIFSTAFILYKESLISDDEYDNVSRSLCLLRRPVIKFHEDIGDAVFTDIDLDDSAADMLNDVARRIFYSRSDRDKHSDISAICVMLHKRAERRAGVAEAERIKREFLRL